MSVRELLINSVQFAPELFLVLAAFAIVLFDFLSRSKQRDLGIVSLIAFAVAGGMLWFISSHIPPQSSVYFSGMVTVDAFSTAVRFVICIVMFLAVLLSMGDRFHRDGDTAEYYALLLFMSVGLSGLSLSKNLLMIYLSLELVSLSSYILVSLTKREFFSSEASLKYFLFGALSTGIMLYGMSLVYGLTGSIDLDRTFAAVAAGGLNAGALYLAVVLVLAGLGFKIAMVPFQMWAPDVYQGAPTPVTALISVGPKVAAFAVLLRFFYKGIGDFGMNWYDLAGFLSVATMTVGNVIAVSQNNVKRMLAYSSIAQAGYILIGFAVPSALGKQSVIIYLLAYVFMNLGAFALVIPLIRAVGSEEISDLKGVAQKAPVAALALTLFLLSLAGIPPMAGFLGKFYIFSAAVQGQKLYLAVAGVLNSVIALYYYVRVIKYMYLDQPEKDLAVALHPAIVAAVIIAAAGTLSIGIYPEPFIRIVAGAVSIF
ncbi:MAG TPA: NADH-quinone oxidoreductase subunit N [bacterium]|nr:NADH-quinone oxidoreductase subunit N [bacterium]